MNIVRQTVSKWEKGLSVPDANLLVRLAENLEVSVAELLGGNIPDSEDTNELAEAFPDQRTVSHSKSPVTPYLENALRDHSSTDDS